MFFPTSFISSGLKNAVQQAQAQQPQLQQPQLQQPQLQQPQLQQPQAPAYTGGGGWEDHLVRQVLQQPQMQQPQMQQPQMQQMQQPSGMHNALFMRLMQARGINPYQYNPQPQQSPQFDMQNFRMPFFGGSGFF